MTQLKDFHQQFVIDTDETVYSEAFDLSTEVVQQVSATAVASSWVAGAVLITPQRSFDGENWADVATAFSSITADGISNTTIEECQPLLRFKVVSSSSADVTIDLYAIVSESAGDGGGTSGGATEAKQDAQTAILTTIDTDTGAIAGSTSTTATNTGTIASSTSTISSNIIGMRNEVASEAKQDTMIQSINEAIVGYNNGAGTKVPVSASTPMPITLITEEGVAKTDGQYLDKATYVQEADVPRGQDYDTNASLGVVLIADVSALSGVHAVDDLCFMINNFETTGIYYAQIFDTDITPSGTPLFELPVAPASNATTPAQYSIYQEIKGLKLTTGFTLALSSTRGTFTSTNKNASVTANYRQLISANYAP